MRFNDIKEFDIYNVLGKGSFATVFRAVPKMGSQEVAIKMIDKKIMKVKNMVPRVRNEVELHSRLKHPSILELYSYFEDKNFVYLVLELCQIGELGAYIMNNKISNQGILEQNASYLLAQIIEGVLYLHQHSIVHRDLTISNILLDKNLYVKIADFGLAIHLTKPDEKHYTMCGTPNFISPETVSNTAHGMQVDIWSLGCILYTMLCGTPPFDTQTIETTFSKIVTGKFTIPPYLSSDAYDLIVKFLRNDPKSRIKLTDAFKHPFIKKYHTVSPSRNGNLDESSIMIFGDKPNFQINDHQFKNNFDNRENFYTPQNQSAIPCEDRDIYRGRNKKISCPPKLSVLEETTDYSSRGDEDNQLLTNAFSSKTHPPNQDRSNSPENFIHNLRDQLTSLNLKLAERKNSTYGTKNLPQNINDRPRPNINDENNYYESKISNRNKENAINKRLFSNSNFPFTDVTNNNNNLAKIIEKCPHPYNHKDFKGPIKRNNTPKKKRDESTLRESISKRRRKQEEITKEKLENFVAGPLNTARLKPFKQKNGDVIMSILPGGDVSLEYYSTTTRPPKNSISNFDNDQNNHRNNTQPTRQQTAILRQIFKVSHDGLKIEIYDALDNIRNTGLTLCQNNNYNNQNSNDFNTMYSERITDVYNENNTIYTPANGRPPLPNNDRGFKIYAFDNLPRPYWKKYGLASRFVKIVRMKTPKVTVYTHDAKCHLMENSPNPDFEALFYDGPKFVISNNKIPQNSAYPTEKDDFHTLKIKHLNMESKIVKDISYYAPYLNKNGKMAHNLKDSAMYAPNGQKIDRDILQNLAKAFDYREYCFQVEKSLESLTTDPTTSTIYISSTNNTSPFPIVVGTNPKRLLTYNPLNQMPLGENNNNKVSYASKKEITTNLKSELKNTQFTSNEKDEALKNSHNHDAYNSKRDRIASDRYDDQNYTQGTNRISKNSQTPSHHQQYPNETLMTSFDEISPQSNNLISAYVPGNCWGLYDPRTKKITAKFLDGIQLVIDADHLNRIKYIDTNNSANEDYYKNLSYVSHDLTINPNLPDHIKDKLNVIPLLVQNIKANCTKV